MGKTESLGWTSWPVWVIVINVFVASGFSLAGLVTPSVVLPTNVEPTAGSAIFAMYAAARTIPLAAAVLIAIYRSDGKALMALAVLAGIVQSLDGLIGILQRDAGKTLGPFILAGLTFYAIRTLSRNRPAD